MLGINNACSQARTFFTQQPDTIKQTIKGYSGFGTELVRGEIPMPKESVYFFRRNGIQRQGAPPDFHRSVTLLYKVRHDNTCTKAPSRV